MADITITYQGNTIAEISDSTQKALKTRGKFLTSDIGVTYEKPSGSESPTYHVSNVLGFPNGIIADNGALVSTASANLWDGTTGTSDEFIDESGNVVQSTGSITSPFISVLQNHLYVWSGTSQTSSSSNHRVHGFDASGNWVEMITKQQPSAGAAYSIMFAINNPNITQIKMSCVGGDTNVSLICYS